MVLTFDVSDKAGISRGVVNVKLDWGGRQWSLVGDPNRVFERLGFSSGGSFEVRSWAVIWLQAQSPSTTCLIIWDAPTGETDPAHAAGQARIFEPKDPAFKDAVIGWTVGQSLSTSSATAAAPALTPVRTRVIDVILPEVLPCVFPTGYVENGKQTPVKPPKGSAEAKYFLNPYNPWRRGAGTTCYTLPAYVASKLGKPFRFPVTTGLPKEGKRYQAWLFAKDVPSGPKPGDLYALCTGELKDENITHVGVILSSTGTIWKTGDTGQGDGYAGLYGVERAYNKTANTLEGETHDGKKQRPIYGWVDLDLLVK
jgi:hypothetical protein